MFFFCRNKVKNVNSLSSVLYIKYFPQKISNTTGIIKKGLELFERKLNFFATPNLLKCITQPADVIMYHVFFRRKRLYADLEGNKSNHLNGERWGFYKQ